MRKCIYIFSNSDINIMKQYGKVITLFFLSLLIIFSITYFIGEEESLYINQYIVFLWLSIFTVLFAIHGLYSKRLSKVLVDNSKIQAKSLLQRHNLSLVQTMNSLLIEADKLDDVRDILKEYLPQVIPELNGFVFIKNNNDTLEKLIKWGDGHEIALEKLSLNCWQHQFLQEQSAISVKTHQCLDKDCQWNQQSLCIKLEDDNQLIGVLHLHHEDVTVTNQYKNMALYIAEHLSIAFANFRLKAQLINQATRDPLTNLYNRRFMFESLERVLNQAERHQTKLALLMIDIDNFKSFNDKYGHEAGDMVLAEVAELLINNLRLEDVACRYGGEEFCIICPETQLNDAYLLAEKLRKCVENYTVDYDGEVLNLITFSIGLALYPNHGNNAHSLISSADIALYKAKNSGRNSTQVALINQSEAGAT